MLRWRHEDVPQPRLPRLVLEFVEYGRDLGPAVDRGGLLVIDRTGRHDMLLHERASALTPFPGFGRLFEIHASAPDLPPASSRPARVLILPLPIRLLTRDRKQVGEGRSGNIREN